MSLKNIMRQDRNPYLLGNDVPIGRQTEYFAQESIDFIKSLGKYANNNYNIEIQKWGNPEKEVISCRIEDSFDEQANLKRGDDWKDILFYEPVNDITIGMFAWFEGNTWMGFNTRNIASLTSSITVRRCDNVLNFVDEYNNVTPVPFVFDKYTILNSTTIEKASQPVSLINGYKNAWIQYNDLTATMKTNDRFIINGMAFSVRGIDKVSRQKTDERNSVHMIAFALMRTEERDGDDLVNDIADADANKWEIATGVSSITGAVGGGGRLTANMLHNGVVDNTVNILFDSTNTDVVRTGGEHYTIVGEGEADILCRFDHNPDITATIHVTGVASTPDTYAVAFAPIEAQIAQFESKTLEAYLVRNGEPMPYQMTFTASGVPSKYYTMSEANQNSVSIVCNAPYSKNKLTVTAKAEVDGTEYEDSISLSLVPAY